MSKTVWLDVEIRKLTELGVLVHNGERQAWVPRSSIIDYEDDLEEGAEIKIELAEWLAADKGLV